MYHIRKTMFLIGIICFFVLSVTLLVNHMIRSIKWNVRIMDDTERELLQIVGQGRMKDYSYEEACPWKKYGENYTLSDVYVSEGIEHIGEYSFSSCRALESVTLPDNVISIGKNAFADDENLKVINLPDSITEIEEYVFSGCTSLPEIELPCNLKTIKSYAFKNCKGLKHINIPENVRCIGENAFYGSGLEGTVNIPESIQEIGEGAFSGCIDLKVINVDPDNANYYSADGVLFERETDKLLAYPAGRENTVYEIPEGVKTLSKYAFEDSILANIILPMSLEIMDMGTFYNAVYLENIIIPEGVEVIPADCFHGCTKLKSIDIPGSVRYIVGDAFVGCESLVDINIATENTHFKLVDGAIYDKRMTQLVCYLPTIEKREYIAPESLNSIEMYAFSENKYLEKVVLPKEMYCISCFAFYQCSSLKEIIMPEKIQCLGEYFVSECNELVKMKIPEGITKIEYWTIGFCENLKTVELPISVKMINPDIIITCPSIFEILYEGTEKQWTTVEVKYGKKWPNTIQVKFNN